MSEKKPGYGCVWIFVGLLLVGVVWTGISELGSASPPEPGEFHNADTTAYSAATRYDGGAVPGFTPDAAQELSAGLAELEKAYGVCFGWSLEDGSTKQVRAGSSRGPGTAASTCPRWLETRVSVGYTSDSSESLDGVSVRVEGSPEFGSLPRQEDFARLGVHGPALVEDPIGGTGHAALGLPLLMVESGGLPAVPTPPPADRPVPKPLGRAGGSDFPLSTTLTLSGLGAGVVLCVVVGFWLRARARKTNPPRDSTGSVQPGQRQPGVGSRGGPGPSRPDPPRLDPPRPEAWPEVPRPDAPQAGWPQPGQVQPGQSWRGYPQQPAPSQQPYPQQQPWPGQRQPQSPGQPWPGQQQPPEQQPGQPQPQQSGQSWPGRQPPAGR